MKVCNRCLRSTNEEVATHAKKLCRRHYDRLRRLARFLIWDKSKSVQRRAPRLNEEELLSYRKRSSYRNEQKRVFNNEIKRALSYLGR